MFQFKVLAETEAVSEKQLPIPDSISVPSS